MNMQSLLSLASSLVSPPSTPYVCDHVDALCVCEPPSVLAPTPVVDPVVDPVVRVDMTSFDMAARALSLMEVVNGEEIRAIWKRQCASCGMHRYVSMYHPLHCNECFQLFWTKPCEYPMEDILEWERKLYIVIKNPPRFDTSLNRFLMREAKSEKRREEEARKNAIVIEDDAIPASDRRSVLKSRNSEREHPKAVKKVRFAK